MHSFIVANFSVGRSKFSPDPFSSHNLTPHCALPLGMSTTYLDMEEHALQHEYRMAKQLLTREKKRMTKLQAELKATEPLDDKVL